MGVKRALATRQVHRASNIVAGAMGLGHIAPLGWVDASSGNCSIKALTTVEGSAIVLFDHGHGRNE